jgi:hypothetical protein
MALRISGVGRVRAGGILVRLVKFIRIVI